MGRSTAPSGFRLFNTHLNATLIITLIIRHTLDAERRVDVGTCTCACHSLGDSTCNEMKGKRGRETHTCIT